MRTFLNLLVGVVREHPELVEETLNFVENVIKVKLEKAVQVPKG